MTLIQQLVEKKIIEKKQAISLMSEAKTLGLKEEELLLKKKIVEETFLFALKSKNSKFFLKKVVPQDISLEVLNLIPEEAAIHYKMVPLVKKGNNVEVGMIYPEDFKAKEALKFLARQGQFNFEIFLITFTDFNSILKQYRTLSGEVEKTLEEIETESEIKEVKTRISSKKTGLEKLVEEAPITKMVAVILRHAVDGRASDIHIEPGQENLRVRFRVDGVLYPSIFLPMDVHPAVVARIKILSNLRIDESRLPQDGRFSTEINKQNIDFRVSTFPSTLGEKVVIRVLDIKKGLKSLEELGIEKRNFEVIKRNISKPFGLILATGPTGSGKTTTLYAILNILNKEGVNIVTLEDPVEYFIKGISQSQIRPEIDYSFATGLRHIVRQDPDIIMVGEIRDKETAELAIHAALTGHLVLSTLHTNNAFGVIPRLIDLGVEPFLISSTLQVALAQRLVKQMCPHCKKEKKPSKEIKELILEEINSLPVYSKKMIVLSKSFMIYEFLGCKECSFGKSVGRIGLFEAIEMTDKLAEIIAKDITEAEIQKQAFAQGMLTMKQDGILKVLAGVTTIEEVLRATGEE